METLFTLRCWVAFIGMPEKPLAIDPLIDIIRPFFLEKSYKSLITEHLLYLNAFGISTQHNGRN